MNLDRIRDIANAMLYEGYILYPYRASSIKNRQRWTFGNVFPEAFGTAYGDAARMQTQVLVEGSSGTTVEFRVRFLHLCIREVAKLPQPVAAFSPQHEAKLVATPRLEIDGQLYLAWEEAIEREVAIATLTLGQLAGGSETVAFCFDGQRQFDPIRNARQGVVGAFIRATLPIEGAITVTADDLGGDLYRVGVIIENVSRLSADERGDRNKAQRRAFASTHTILGVQQGAFCSLLEPSEGCREAAAQCENRGTWPVLVGAAGERNTMLSSPIILYDYPAVAPESRGDLFDGTEIDEILTLRILAMTDAEKREMASVDARARALLERTQAMTPEDFAHLHGAFRGTSVSSRLETVDGDLAPRERGSLATLLDTASALAPGRRVRLRPRERGDIMDLVLKDQIAVIERIERDFDDRLHVAVTLVDDPGRDLGAAGFPGHRFYFAQDEVEPLGIGGEP